MDACPLSLAGKMISRFAGRCRMCIAPARDLRGKSSLLPEQLFVMQMDEFMRRRYEFRFNQLTSQVECRQRNSFDFYFRPVDKRLMSSITMNAQYEGIKLWDKDVVRYLNSDRVPVYQPVEEFLYELPRWNGKDYIGDLAGGFPATIPIGSSYSVVGSLVWWRIGAGWEKIMRTALPLYWSVRRLTGNRRSAA